MKSAYVIATFPELPGRVCHQQARGKGSTKKAAVARAFAALIKQAGRHRWQTIQATVTVVDVPDLNT